MKDPRTGKRVARVNPRSEWEETEVPELRIIDQELWDAVKARQAEVRTEMGKDAGGNALNRVHRRHFLFSGLLTCGCCGGSYAILAADRYGCSNRRGKSTCTNRITIRRQSIEARVLGALKAHMLTPASVERFIVDYAREVATLERESAGRKTALEQQLVATGRRIEGVLRAIEKGP